MAKRNVIIYMVLGIFCLLLAQPQVQVVNSTISVSNFTNEVKISSPIDNSGNVKMKLQDTGIVLPVSQGGLWVNQIYSTYPIEVDVIKSTSIKVNQEGNWVSQVFSTYPIEIRQVNNSMMEYTEYITFDLPAYSSQIIFSTSNITLIQYVLAFSTGGADGRNAININEIMNNVSVSSISLANLHIAYDITDQASNVRLSGQRWQVLASGTSDFDLSRSFDSGIKVDTFQLKINMTNAVNKDGNITSNKLLIIYRK